MPDETPDAPRKILEIIYDGNCPVCSRLAMKTRLEERYELVLTDARNRADLVRRFREQGKDINEGIIVRTESDTYFGAQALIFLDAASSTWGELGVLRPLFRSRTLASLAYPVLVGMRKLLLFILGRRQLY